MLAVDDKIARADGTFERTDTTSERYVSLNPVQNDTTFVTLRVE